MNHLGDFIDLNDTIRNYKPDIYLTRINQTADPSRSTYVPADVKGKTKLIYTVRDGDNLGFISEWYQCRTIRPQVLEQYLQEYDKGRSEACHLCRSFKSQITIQRLTT